MLKHLKSIQEISPFFHLPDPPTIIIGQCTGLCFLFSSVTIKVHVNSSMVEHVIQDSMMQILSLLSMLLSLGHSYLAQKFLRFLQAKSLFYINTIITKVSIGQGYVKKTIWHHEAFSDGDMLPASENS